MPLFEVAIVEKPTKKQAEEGGTERLVFGPKAVIASNGQAAAIAALQGEDALDVDYNRADVLVRPFA